MPEKLEGPVKESTEPKLTLPEVRLRFMNVAVPLVVAGEVVIRAS